MLSARRPSAKNSSVITARGSSEVFGSTCMYATRQRQQQDRGEQGATYTSGNVYKGRSIVIVVYELIVDIDQLASRLSPDLPAITLNDYRLSLSSTMRFPLIGKNRS